MDSSSGKTPSTRRNEQEGSQLNTRVTFQNNKNTDPQICQKKNTEIRIILASQIFSEILDAEDSRLMSLKFRGKYLNLDFYPQPNLG